MLYMYTLYKVMELFSICRLITIVNVICVGTCSFGLEIKPYLHGSFATMITKNVYAETPFFKTLVESGSKNRFKEQFRWIANTTSDNHVLGAHGKISVDSVANRILKDLDTSINPCDNFYRFACGGYIAQTRRPSNSAVLFPRPTDDTIVHILQKQLQRNLFAQDPKPLQKAKLLYRSCIDEYNIENRGLVPVLKFLSDRGGWPVLGQWNDKDFDYIELIARIRPLIKDIEFHYQPTGAIIGTIIQRDFRKKGHYIIYLDQPNFGQFALGGFPNHEVYRLRRDLIYNKAYEEYLVDIAVALGANVATATEDMCDVVRLERELAQNVLFEEERRRVDIRYNKITVFEMIMQYPNIDWMKYLKIVLSTANINVNLSSKIVLWASPYFDKLAGVLKRTSKRTLANYILFRAIQPLLSSLNRDIQYITLRYRAVINGDIAPVLPKRSNYCTRIIMDQMGWIGARLYVDNKPGAAELIKHTRNIGKYIRNIFHSLIEQADWLDGFTKNNVLRKLKSIQTNLGFPYELLHNAFLENHYNKFNIGKNFFENMEEILTKNYKIVLDKLVRRPRIEWLLRPSSISALHNLGTTSIEIPLGIIDEPFFSKDYSPSLNFGGIGFLFGHEYGHGFEVTGSKFDWNGQLRNYWSHFSLLNFANRADCLVDQYSRFYIPEADLKITNGNKTLNENIADNLGVRAGFYAYQKWKKERNINDFVKGIPFTGEQLYFINTARVWCSNTSPVFLRQFPLVDHHAVNELRVIAPLQNMQEFSEAFRCPVGTYMNPPKKCRFF